MAFCALWDDDFSNNLLAHDLIANQLPFFLDIALPARYARRGFLIERAGRNGMYVIAKRSQMVGAQIGMELPEQQVVRLMEIQVAASATRPTNGQSLSKFLVS